MSAHDNRRRDARLPTDGRVIVEARPPGGDGSPAQQIDGSSIDWSAGGLQLRLAVPLLPGNRLRLDVEQGSGRPHLHLVGEVRWLREHDDGWSVGFALLDLPETDIRHWRQLVASLQPA